MSAIDLAFLSSDAGKSAEWSFRGSKWWIRLASRCSGPDCPKLAKLWPHWLSKSEGVEFEGKWYCSRGCLEVVLAGRVHALLSTSHLEKPRAHRFPIGLLLVHSGAISHSQLREAIRMQRESGRGRLGDWLRHTTDLSVQQLTAALGQQWGCPVFPLEQQSAPVAWSDLIPLPLLESAAAVPAYASSDGRLLHLAFRDRVDHTLLYAVEQMLLCRTFPCVATGTAIHAQLERFRKLTSGNDTSFDSVRESHEMTWTICNYAVELHAKRLVLARAGAYIWVRFFRAEAARDLLFRILPDNHPNFADRPPALPKVFSDSADDRKGRVSDALLPL